MLSYIVHALRNLLVVAVRGADDDTVSRQQQE